MHPELLCLWSRICLPIEFSYRKKYSIFYLLTIGPLRLSVLLMFTSMRNMVTSNAMRPGTMSTGMTNPMKDIMVSRPLGKKVLVKKGFVFLFSDTVNPVTENSPAGHWWVVNDRLPMVTSKFSVFLMPLVDLISSVLYSCYKTYNLPSQPLFIWNCHFDTIITW